ncbi:MAG: ABC transporter permease [Pirellulales bacterium]|nr:ABC transporter permease [Pirellulales bacterium]
MSLWKIALRSMQQRLLASSLTGLSMALGVALVITVLVILGVIRDSFGRGAQGYHMIVGPKGGKLQLVLNTVYHLSQPIENLPWSYYKKFKTPGKENFGDYVATAIPFCLGDNYEGYRVVGTTREMFTKLEYTAGRKYEFAAGRNFLQTGFFEAVIGATVARQTGLKLGDSFMPTHGVSENEDGHVHEDKFKVVGILKPTGTPNDRALFINIEGFFLLEGHAKGPGVPHAEGEAAAHAEHHDEHGDHHHHHHEPLPEDQREVTSILVVVKNDLYAAGLAQKINEGLEAQSVAPTREIQLLMEEIVRPIEWLLLFLTTTVVVVAGIGILVSIYNSMNDRQHDIAVMRALGARRGTVMSIVLLESLLLALGGGLVGVLLGHGLIGAIDPIVESRTGVSVGFLQFEGIELILIPGLTVLAALVGFLPSLAAYRTDVAKALTARP